MWCMLVQVSRRGQLQLPVAVRADIRQGAAQWAGNRVAVPLPIRGSGQFEILYLDDVLRIFKSGSSLSVQVRAAAVSWVIACACWPLGWEAKCKRPSSG
jgi:hypothetical protein